MDGYHDEGMRRTTWMADNVLKYHRTLASYVNELIDAGFYIAKVMEPTLPQGWWNADLSGVTNVAAPCFW